MSRLIDADMINYRSDRLHHVSADFIDGIEYANNCVNETPTAIDLVRCKECIWWGRYESISGYKYKDCGRLAEHTKADDYCAWGKRRTDEQVD